MKLDGTVLQQKRIDILNLRSRSSQEFKFKFKQFLYLANNSNSIINEPLTLFSSNTLKTSDANLLGSP